MSPMSRFSICSRTWRTSRGWSHAERSQTKRLDDLEEVRYRLSQARRAGGGVGCDPCAPQTLKDVVVVQTEVEFVPMYRDQPLFAEVDQALRAGSLSTAYLGLPGGCSSPWRRRTTPTLRGVRCSGARRCTSGISWSWTSSRREAVEAGDHPARGLSILRHVLIRFPRYDARQGTGLQMEYIRQAHAAPLGWAAHERAHIRRYAASIARVMPTSSRRADALIFCRIVEPPSRRRASIQPKMPRSARFSDVEATR